MSEIAFSLDNQHLCRAFNVSNAIFSTSGYQVANSSLIGSVPNTECEVLVDGTCYSTAPGSPGLLRYTGHRLADLPDGGRQLTVTLGPERAPNPFELTLVYTLPLGLPVLKKQVRLCNLSSVALRLQNILIETIDIKTDEPHILLLENDYVRAGMRNPDGSTRSPWVEQIRDYSYQILHPMEGLTTFEYPHTLDMVIPAGEEYASFSVWEFAVSNKTQAMRGLDFRRLTRALLPWSTETWLVCQVALPDSIEALYASLDSAAEAGYETAVLFHGTVDGVLTSPLFTNYADYMPRADLFPNGWADVRKMTDYAHAKGLRICFYTIYVTIWDAENTKALTANHWELEFAPDDDSQHWATTVCPASDWGRYVNRQILGAIEAGGFDGIALDGPYYGDVCMCGYHAHAPGGSSQAIGWQRLVELYETLRAQNKMIYAAQGYQAFLHGSCRVGQTGYDESDFTNCGMWQQILSTRRGAFEWTKAFRQEQGVYFIPAHDWLGGPSLVPLEENLAEYNAYMANCFGYGFDGACYQNLAWDGPGSRAIVERWVHFWKAHKVFFKEGYVVHVRKPDGERADAVMHLLPEAGRALVVAYNPADSIQDAVFSLPFAEVGQPVGGWVGRYADDTTCLVEDGTIRFSIPARDALWAEIALT